MPLRPQHQFDWKHALKWLPVYLAVTAVLYVLAAGPLYWRIYAGVVTGTPTPLVQLYAPLMLLCQHSETANAAMNWYVGWWV